MLGKGEEWARMEVHAPRYVKMQIFWGGFKLTQIPHAFWLCVVWRYRNFFCKLEAPCEIPQQSVEVTLSPWTALR